MATRRSSTRVPRPRVARGSAAEFLEAVEEAVTTFGATVAPLLRAGIGQAEANLTFAVETLLGTVASRLGFDVRVHREAADRFLGVRPDLAIDVGGASTGVVELKAPGMGVPGSPRWGKARDRKQWEKLSALPNVLYTDGSQWAVYHFGERFEAATLEGDLARAGSRLRPKDTKFAAVLKDYLLWKPSPPRDLLSLIKTAARLCHLLREDVGEALRRERQSADGPLLSDHVADWQEWLFPDLTDVEFVDAYAQTVTFGLLLARREGVPFEGLELPDIGEKLAKRHLLVGRALSLLTQRPGRGPSIEDRSIVLQTMRRVIGVADWTQWPTAATYHWLYEEFLDAYDPVLRRKTGAYYTPAAVADFMTNFVDEVLQAKLKIRRGLAADNVVVLDPAMGTGTFLQSVIDRVADTVADEGGDVPASLRDLLPRLIGFERQIGPYAVAELKLDQALAAHHTEANDEDFRLYVADTLDDPIAMPIPRRSRPYRPLVDSRIAANKVKTDERVMVVLGNPPYRAMARKFGKWVLDGGRGARSLLDDFRQLGNGRHEYKLHDLAVYFWRWALWKAFESTPDQPAGVVAFITTNAYLDGPGFAGMRRFLRQQADFGWIIDVAPEGHQSEVKTRIFPGVQHPVCIGIFARSSEPQIDQPARFRFIAVAGSQQEKFKRLTSINLTHGAFLDCPIGWDAPFRPVQAGGWTQFPAIDNLLPYTSLGVTSNRAWVRAPDRDSLVERWRELIRAEPSEKRRLLKETRDRTIDKELSGLPGEHPMPTLRQEVSCEPVVMRFGFRSFDRQVLIADHRVVDFIRPELWRIANLRQVYLVTHHGEPLTNGPAAVFSADVPDTHYFNGRGGRVIPLYRDAAGLMPNVAPKLLGLFRKRLGLRISPEDMTAYVAAVISHSGYTERFRDALQQPGVRVPLTADPGLWRRAVELGQRVIWLHTFGERFVDASAGRPPCESMPGRPRVIVPIPGSEEEMPDSMIYDASSARLCIGPGQIGPVSGAVWAYEVSGMKIVKHWFDYRRRNPKGRRGGSPLDNLTATRWTRAVTDELRDLVAVLEGCVALEPEQAELLEQIVAGPLITADDLETAGVTPPPPETQKATPPEDPRSLF
jgi:hypothetical protein